MEIWEFIGLVILVAMFFGISFSAALHGIISFVLWSLVIGVILYGVISIFTYLLQPADVPQKTIQTKPVQQKVVRNTKPIKVPSFVKWLIFLAVSYLFSLLFMVAIGLSETCIKYNVPVFVHLSIPALPFIVVLAVNLIKKIPKNKKRTRR